MSPSRKARSESEDSRRGAPRSKHATRNGSESRRRSGEGSESGGESPRDSERSGRRARAGKGNRKGGESSEDERVKRVVNERDVKALPDRRTSSGKFEGVLAKGLHLHESFYRLPPLKYFLE